MEFIFLPIAAMTRKKAFRVETCSGVLDCKYSVLAACTYRYKFLFPALS